MYVYILHNYIYTSAYLMARNLKIDLFDHFLDVPDLLSCVSHQVNFINNGTPGIKLASS